MLLKHCPLGTFIKIYQPHSSLVDRYQAHLQPVLACNGGSTVASLTLSFVVVILVIPTSWKLDPFLHNVATPEAQETVMLIYSWGLLLQLSTLSHCHHG